MITKIIIINVFILILCSCNSHVRDGNIGDLGKASFDLYDDRDELVVNKESTIIEYNQFVRLFDTVHSDAMRHDGMEGISKLQQQENINNAISLASVFILFEELIKKYPNQDHDRLLYQLSREYEINGDRDAALSTLNRLVSTYPNTQYFDEAQFRRGEILFSKRNFVDAELAYNAVVKYRVFDDKSIYYEQSLYKRGWSQFKQSKYNKALDSFMNLVDLHELNGEIDFLAMSPSDRDFIKDVLRAINLSFSYQAGPISVHDYFKGGKKRIYEHTIYTSLAKFYQQKQHYSDAVSTYRLFVSNNKLHPKSPDFLLEVINIYNEGDFLDLLISAKKDFVQRYSINNAYWALFDEHETKSQLLALKENLNELARYYHALAQKDKNHLNYREAQRWYRTWLSSFPNDSEIWKINFLLAEILNEDKQYEAAVLQYEITAYDYKLHPKSSKAAYAALLAYGKRESELTGIERQWWHRQSIDSSVRFSNKFPQHPEANKVLTKAVQNLYQLGEYEKSHQIARQVSLSIKDKALLASVWVVMAHIEFEWRDYKESEKSYAKALSYLAVGAVSRQALIKKQAVAVYKQGEISRQNGNLQEAVKHFSRVKSVSNESGLVASAEFDQASALIGLRHWAKAALVLEGFRRNNIKHKLQPEVTKKLAVVYLEKGDLKKSSIEFERVSHLKETKPYRLEALWRSAELAEQANDSVRAKKIFTDFVKRFPAPLERNIEAHQRLVEIYERESNKKSAKLWRQRLVTLDKNAGKKRTDRTQYLAAKASFALVEPIFISYRKSILTVPLKKSLKVKKKLMDKALALYKGAASYGVAEVLTASTYRIAKIYQDLGLAIYNSERPKKLNEDELEQYDFLLEELAYPFEEKAIEFHEINVKHFADGLYGVWVWKSLEQLKEFLPVRYNKKERNDVISAEIL